MPKRPLHLVEVFRGPFTTPKPALFDRILSLRGRTGSWVEESKRHAPWPDVQDVAALRVNPDSSRLVFSKIHPGFLELRKGTSVVSEKIGVKRFNPELIKMDDSAAFRYSRLIKDVVREGVPLAPMELIKPQGGEWMLAMREPVHHNGLSYVDLKNARLNEVLSPERLRSKAFITENKKKVVEWMTKVANAGYISSTSMFSPIEGGKNIAVSSLDHAAFFGRVRPDVAAEALAKQITKVSLNAEEVSGLRELALSHASPQLQTALKQFTPSHRIWLQS